MKCSCFCSFSVVCVSEVLCGAERQLEGL